MSMQEEDSKQHKMSRAEAGRLGGEARAQKYDHNQLSQQAKQGAQTIERVRPGFHSEIGRKGGQAGGSKGRSQFSQHDEDE